MKARRTMRRKSMKRKDKKRSVTRKNKRSGGANMPWSQFTAKVYKEMKAKDKNATFSDALVEASKRKKRGEM